MRPDETHASITQKADCPDMYHQYITPCFPVCVQPRHTHRQCTPRQAGWQVSVHGEDAGGDVRDDPVHAFQQVVPGDGAAVQDEPVVRRDLVQVQALIHTTVTDC